MKICRFFTVLFPLCVSPCFAIACVGGLPDSEGLRVDWSSGTISPPCVVNGVKVDAELRRAIAAFDTYGLKSTPLSAQPGLTGSFQGLPEGAKYAVLNLRRHDNVLRSLILLADGQTFYIDDRNVLTGATDRFGPFSIALLSKPAAPPQ